MELEKNALSSLSLCHYGETENPSIIIWLKYPISFPFECRCAAVCSLSCALKDAIRVRQVDSTVCAGHWVRIFLIETVVAVVLIHHIYPVHTVLLN
jgi:hypothetical protein